MPPRDVPGIQIRARIAEAAARLIAEHGIRDYAQAKRKAARSLGLPEGHSLPSNDEIDAALVYRQSLFEPAEQAQRLLHLRQQALAVMREFEDFSPILVGLLASGIASEHSLIELDLDAESSKDFERFLINRGIEFKIQDKGGRMAYLIYSEPTDVLVRLNPGDTHHGGSGPRIRLTREHLEKLLQEALPQAAPASGYNS
jgi:hypothetical protein